MPDDKRNQQKGKSDAKEQRKPRQGRQKSGPAAKITPAEKKNEEPKAAAPQKPVYEDPGPEFYKNLKRETDEILKITEEANSKYKKKEIQSNWSKYEMPIESYEVIEEQENMGADYEQLVQMPLSAGGHFQFKHEKSWDVSTGPSPYDRYFQINMNNLANAICTIPFYERNDIDKNIFSESDVLTMNNRAVKYKQKYYNDKSYTTPELEAEDKILNNFKEALSNPDIDNRDSRNKDDGIKEKDTADESLEDLPVQQNSNQIEFQLENKILANLNSDVKDTRPQTSTDSQQKVAEGIDDIDDLILEEKHSSTPVKVEDTRPHAVEMQISSKNEKRESSSMGKLEKGDKTKDAKSEKPSNPVIESPEDLEKWLDDFLDG